MSNHDVPVALVRALERGDIDSALQILAEQDNCGILTEPVGALRVTAIQLAAWRESMELLEALHKQGADLNASDKLGRCALHYAAQQGNAVVVKWLLDHGAVVKCRVGVNSWPRDVPYRTDVTNAASCTIGRNLPLPECWGRTALHQAVKGGHYEVVKILANAGAEIDAQDERGVTPLLLAGANVNPGDSNAMFGYEEIVDILVSKNAAVNTVHPDTGNTALHHACTLGNSEATKRLIEGGAWPLSQCTSTGSTPLHFAAGAGHLNTLLVLLQAIDPMLINTQDEVGRTPLHRAVYQGHRDCVLALVNMGGNLAAETKTGVTVIDAIFADIPKPLAFLKDIFDSRVRPFGSSATGRGVNVNVDYSVLTPPGELQMAVVSALIVAVTDIDQLGILQHPLLEAFLMLKWSRLRCFFFLLVFVHVLFVISLSSYSIVLLHDSDNCALPRRALLFCSCILLFHAMMQILMVPRYYLRQFETWLFMVCAGMSLVISVAGEFIVESMTEIENGNPWVLHAISVAILFAWIQMMLLIGRFPTWGYYVLMFSTVLKNVVKVLLAFGCLIVGFALAFSVLFHGKDQFRYTWRAIVKTVAMMMGEYNYDELFTEENVIKSYLPITSRFVFVTFVMLASIVLMNLMVGLAVNDIQGLQKEGHIRRLLKQAEFVAHLERVMSHRISKRLPWQIRKLLDSRRIIPTNTMLSSYGTNHIFPVRLIDALFMLAAKNSFKETGSQLDSGGKNGGSFGMELHRLKQQVHNLQDTMTPNQWMQMLSHSMMERKIGKRRKSTVT